MSKGKTLLILSFYDNKIEKGLEAYRLELIAEKKEKHYQYQKIQKYKSLLIF